MGIKFVTGEPALLIGKNLVIADLHLGIEYEFRRSGINMPSQTEKVLKRIIGIVNKTRAVRVIFLGDVKHKVPGMSFQEIREVPWFFNKLSKKVGIEVIPGNHDGGLGELVPDIKIHPSSGILLGNVFLCHGHAWPHRDFLKAGSIAIGHNHTQVEFRDSLGYRWLERVWVRTGLNKKRLSERFGSQRKLPELVIMPSFNEFSGGLPINRKGSGFMGPIGQCAHKPKSGVYLLDGTFLGELGKL